MKYFFQNYINKNSTVLDVPCGYGVFINNIVCKDKYAVDINNNCKEYLPKNVKFLLGSSTKLKLKDKSIDAIFVSNFFEHISRDDIVRTIKEFRRILRPDGRVLILQPNIRFAAKDYWMFFDHITPVDDRALIEIFTALDFSLVHNIERFLPFTMQSKFPKPAFLIRLYLQFSFLWPFFGKQSLLFFKN